MQFNHPEYTPSCPLFVEKLSSMKLIPSAKKAGDCCYTVCPLLVIYFIHSIKT